MLKIDKPFIDEFLGNDEILDEHISPCKTWRIYTTVKKSVAVATPLMKDCFEESFNSFKKFAKSFGFKTPLLYKRGKYTIWVNEKN